MIILVVRPRGITTRMNSIDLNVVTSPEVAEACVRHWQARPAAFRPLRRCVVVVLAMIVPGSIGTTLPRSRPGHHEIELLAPRTCTNQPLVPLEDGGVRAVPGSHLGGVGLQKAAGKSALKPFANAFSP